ncbi:MAG: Co/Zn/Cd efflux system component [Halioglobus sp.]|jgi:Co/Zn/Cd efflux system component
MDCPSEETLIRMKLEGIESLASINFDIANRKLSIFHLGPVLPIRDAIASLNLGDSLISTEETNEPLAVENNNQRKLLWTVLIINFAFFAIEMSTGLISKSMGLVADSLDMLADAFVYGISIMAVGSTLVRKKAISRIAGYFQITLALLGFLEILRRFFGSESLPNFQAMIIVSILALVANWFCLYLLQKSRSKDELHIKASLIFTSNDIIINAGVILAGSLVYLTSSAIPDLLVGFIVFILVLQGAFRILNLSN